jgi:hypothetical protein
MKPRLRKNRDKDTENIELSFFLEKELNAMSKLSKKEEEENKRNLLKQKELREQAIKNSEVMNKAILSGKVRLEDLTKEAPKNSSYKAKAYVITFTKHPEYIWLVFAVNKSQALGMGHAKIARVYFNSSLEKSPVLFTEARERRLPQLDKYAKEGKVPILELIKAGFTFRCVECGKILGLEELDEGDCHILEGEGDAIPFTIGKVICDECWNRY